MIALSHAASSLKHVVVGPGHLRAPPAVCPARSTQYPPVALCFTSALDNHHLTSSLQGEPGPRGLVGPPGSRGNPVSDSVLIFFFFKNGIEQVNNSSFCLDVYVKACLLVQAICNFLVFSIYFSLNSKTYQSVISMLSIKSR